MRLLPVFLTSVALTSCQEVGNLSGANKDSAEKEAWAFAENMGFKPAGVECARNDSDGDGYVSCTVSSKKTDGSVQLTAIECAAALTTNSGCRMQKIAR